MLPYPLPVWVLLALLQGAVLLLQWFPPTGVFLMLFAAPVWSALLVNMILIAMGVEAFLGRTPRALLIVPVAVYAFTTAFAAVGWLDYRALAREIETANAAQRISFDPTVQDLVFATSRDAQQLVSGYVLDVAYGPAAGGVAAYRVLTRDVCDSIKEDTHRQVRKLGVQVRGVFARNACLLQTVEAPAAARLSFHVREETVQRRATSATLTRVTAVAPDGTIAAVASGTAWIPAPAPLPMVGCALNSAAAKWECFATMLSLPRQIGAETGGIARLLGLQPRTLVRAEDGRSSDLDAEETRIALGATGAIEQARAAADRIAERTLASLPGMIANPKVDYVQDLQYTLVKYADRAAPMAGLMVAGLERTGREKRTQMRRILAAAVAALPQHAFAPHQGRVLALMRDPDLQRDAPDLLARLGGAGRPAIPILVGAVQEQRHEVTRSAALLGLCRAGPDAAPHADLVASLLRQDRRENVLQAGILALRGMGRVDAAEATLESLPPGKRRWLENALRKIDRRPSDRACEPESRIWM